MRINFQNSRCGVEFRVAPAAFSKIWMVYSTGESTSNKNMLNVDTVRYVAKSIAGNHSYERLRFGYVICSIAKKKWHYFLGPLHAFWCAHILSIATPRFQWTATLHLPPLLCPVADSHAPGPLSIHVSLASSSPGDIRSPRSTSSSYKQMAMAKENGAVWVTK